MSDLFGNPKDRYCLDVSHMTVNFQALGVINKHDLSAALFANGWVYEKWGEEKFVQNENK